MLLLVLGVVSIGVAFGLLVHALALPRLRADHLRGGGRLLLRPLLLQASGRNPNPVGTSLTGVEAESSRRLVVDLPIDPDRPPLPRHPQHHRRRLSPSMPAMKLKAAIPSFFVVK
jgi:hypothetical protein